MSDDLALTAFQSGVRAIVEREVAKVEAENAALRAALAQSATIRQNMQDQNAGLARQLFELRRKVRALEAQHERRARDGA